MYIKRILFIVVFLGVITISGCYKDQISGGSVMEIETDICNYPFMKVGTGCCLDKNSNDVCDSEEISDKSEDKIIVSSSNSDNLPTSLENLPLMVSGEPTNLDALPLMVGGSTPGGLSNVDVTQIQSTAQGIAVLFPVDEIKTTQDAINIMIPTGTPEYGNEMGVSFDKPVESMELMAKSYNSLMQQIKSENPEIWQRYLSLAAAPRGISCEFCCGLGAQSIDTNGKLKCDCKHNFAIQTIALWLIKNTDYSDAEVLREVYRWKALWFPKSMVELAGQIAGVDTSALEDLPKMVGSC